MRLCTVHIAESQITNPKAVRNLFEGCKDGKYILKLERAKKSRSLPQNAYLWGIVNKAVQIGLYDMGWDHVTDPVAAHEWLKEEFLKERIVNEKTGEVRERIKSTTELSTVEFSEYIERIVRWAAEYLGIVIPLPGEQAEMFLDHV